MRRRLLFAVAILAAILVPLGLQTSSWAGTGAPPTEPAPAAPDVTVGPGQSIQAAVNHAKPGDVIFVKPGVYHESVLVRTNGLSIRGSGASENGTVLLPPTTRQTRCFHGGAGFCVFGHQGPNGPVRVRNVTISGFLIRGFEAFGVVAQGSVDSVVRHVRADDDGQYGITSFASHGTRFLFNTTSGNGDSGLYVGDSPDAAALLVGNRSFGNEFGILLRDSAVGSIKNNTLFNNCVGLVVVDTPAPTQPHDYVLWRNQSYHNDRFCKGDPNGPPPTTGTGIAIVGGRHIIVKGNTVWANRPSHGGAAFPGGIVVTSAKPLGGAVESHNVVKFNQAYRDKPADIVWDGNGSGNQFVANRCGTSTPDGMCH
jgi:parallel beta-helix repeat protein